MAHEHDHDRDRAPKDFGRAFAIGIALQTTFIAAEVVVGLLANSLALLADAGHNASDVLALGLAWAASHVGRRRASKARTYGFKSASILAALANALTLVFVNGAVAWEALLRFRRPEEVAPISMIAVSVAGVAVNGFSAWLFASGSKRDVNIRAAFVHLASDAAVSAGVAVTGVLIHFTHATWLDPAASLVVASVVLATTLSLLRRAIDLAMHAVPEGIDVDAVRRWLLAREGVLDVHDLHVWALSTTENALTAHLAVRRMPSGPLACEIDAKLRHEFRVHHVTLQIDPTGASCALEPDEVI